MNILETIKSQRERLDAKVNAAIAERDAFIASISTAVGQVETRNRRHRMSAAGRKRISEAAKKRWAAKNAAKK
jgi:hypothetical protein